MTSFLRLRLGLIALTCISLFSCSDKKEDLQLESVSDYIPVQVGKYITYRLDSLVFVDFQRDPETHSYLVKHVVDAQITDGQGNPSYRIYRYIKNADGSGEWNANGSYVITPFNNRIELVEDNLRFIKLQAPVREGTTWRGNTYLPTDPYDSYGFNFSNDDDIRTWDFYYQLFESSYSVNGETYADVWTVEQQDDFSNVPVADPESYGYKSRSVEKYSKGIGLVYREYELWEYQPNLSGPDPYYTGFGITMWMVDHN